MSRANGAADEPPRNPGVPPRIAVTTGPAAAAYLNNRNRSNSMIVRTLNEILGTEREVDGET